MSKSNEELKRDTSRGRHADAIINDPVVKDVLQNLRQTVYDNFMSSKFDARDEREDLYRMSQIIDKFEQSFKALMLTGKNSQALLKKREETN